MRPPIPVIVIPVVVFLLFAFVPGVREQPWTGLRIFGAAMAVIGFGLAGAARRQLGSSFTVMPEARALVTHGLYSRLRNPIYVFVDVMLLGLILVFDMAWLFALLAVVVILQTVQAHREAKVLEAKFGQQYLEYRKQTWF